MSTSHQKASTAFFCKSAHERHQSGMAGLLAGKQRAALAISKRRLDITQARRAHVSKAQEACARARRTARKENERALLALGSPPWPQAARDAASHALASSVLRAKEQLDEDRAKIAQMAKRANDHLDRRAWALEREFNKQVALIDAEFRKELALARKACDGKTAVAATPAKPLPCLHETAVADPSADEFRD